MRQSDKDKLAAILESEISRADGGESSELMANRKQAMEYYWGKARGDEKPNRSHDISTDVADMINAQLAIIGPMITSDAVVEFEADGPEDQAQAAAESKALNSIVMDRNKGRKAMLSAVKDSLLLRNGCMKVTIRDSVSTQRFPVADASADEVRAWLASPGPNEERKREGGELVQRTRRRMFVTSAVPIANVLYSDGHDGPLQTIRFFSERLDRTRSELIDLGIPKGEVKELSTYSDPQPANAQRARGGGDRLTNAAETSDQDLIECHDCYILTDLDGDGISERYKVLFATRQTVLAFEQVEILPYALGSPFLNPHEITGESMFDHLKGTQDVKTKFIRQHIDNVTLNNNGRYAYDPDQTAEEDVLNPRPGGGIRARNPAQSVVPIPVPDVQSGILAALAYQDQRRTERGGAALELMNGQAQLVGETAHGVERQMAMREAMSSMIANNLADDMVRDLYLILHAMMRRYARDPVKVEMSGQVVQMDARRWPERVNVAIELGMTPGARGYLQGVLGQTSQMQLMALQAGGDGVLVDFGTIYRTQMLLLRLAGVDNPERLWIDPQSPGAQKAIEGKRAQAEQAKVQQQQLAQVQAQLEEGKRISEDERHAGDLKFKYDELAEKSALEEAKLVANGTLDLTKQRMQDDENRRSARAAERNSSDEGAIQ